MRRKADDGVIETQLLVEERKLRKSKLPAEMAADPLLTAAEIAKAQRVDPKTVSRWAQRGLFGGPPNVIRLPGHNGARRIRTSAYNEAVRQMTEKMGN
jgi:hypothetical protein